MTWVAATVVDARASMALLQSFGTNVGHRLEEGRVVVGRFDGRAASIACATTGGKVLVHRTSAGATDDGDAHADDRVKCG